MIDGFLAQASIVSVGVRAMLDRAVAENSSQILDGVSIVPGLVDLAAYAENAHVIFLVVATLDERAFRARFESRARTSHRPEHRYLEHFDAILKIQDHFLELADRHDIPIVDNESIDVSVLSIIKHVTETLRKVGSLRRAGTARVAVALLLCDVPLGSARKPGRRAHGFESPGAAHARRAAQGRHPRRDRCARSCAPTCWRASAPGRRSSTASSATTTPSCPPSRTRCSAATT